MAGRIILLNGASSSGKTTIARRLQAIWPTPLLYLGIDTAIGLLPYRYTGTGSDADAGYHLIPSTGSEPSVKFALGPVGRTLNRAVIEFSVGLADKSFDVVMDLIIIDDESVNEIASVCASFQTWLIGIHCDAAVLAERERIRGDRLIGLAGYQAHVIHSGERPYDLVVDTTSIDEETIASIITNYVVKNRPI